MQKRKKNTKNNNVINLNLFFWSYLFVFSYIYIEMFYSLIFVSLFKNLKNYNINFSKKVNYYLFKNQIFHITINLNILYVLTLKLDVSSNNMIAYIFVYLLLSKIFKSYINYNVMFINFNIVFFLFFLTFINSIVVFFLFIEFYSIIFYFFFLNHLKTTHNTTLLQFKNMLLLYLINNFFVTILFLLGLTFVLEQFGTTNFLELSYLHATTTSKTPYLLIISFILKLALPGFHYLKLEIYKYLTNDIVILYSVITLYLNYLLMIFFFNHNIIFNTLNIFKLFNLLVIFIIFIFINKIKINSFQEFIAYSGFATNNLILLSFII